MGGNTKKKNDWIGKKGLKQIWTRTILDPVNVFETERLARKVGKRVWNRFGLEMFWVKVLNQEALLAKKLTPNGA